MRHTARGPALMLALLLPLGSAQAALSWADLWHTPDQQADAHLRAGDAAQAARTYSDPRRKAYAELKAGQYQAAAKDYAPFKDRDALYNRGNALARAGQLPQALQAYEQALALDPQDRQARHNRDLVAKALKQQHDKPPDQQPGAPAQAPDQNDAHGEGKNKGGGNDAGKGGGKGQQPAPSSNPPPGERPGHKPGQAPGQAPNQQAGQQPGNRPDQSQAAEGQPDPGTDARQARQDMASLQGRAGPSTGTKPATPPPAAGADGQGQQAPTSEQSLAESQWLRRIPDDPGGLLRRKFLIQHMLKQQQETQP